MSPRKTSSKYKTKKRKKIRKNNEEMSSSMSDDVSSHSSDDDELVCALCGGIGYLSDEDDDDIDKSANKKLIGPFRLSKNRKNEEAAYIHFGCGLWSPDIQKTKNDATTNDQGYNVTSCIKRTKQIK